MEYNFTPVGFVHSNIKTQEDAPRHHTVSDETGIIEILPEYQEGLYRIEERDCITVLFFFDKIDDKFDLWQKPPTATNEKGVFSTCSPQRPNKIGVDILKLLKVDGNKLHVKHLDILDGTPVLDIKPFKPLWFN
ncbi:MAG: tRNA (N6-threonylcarbamoyladenosine(37)-N6)-methyltransferase TrmO [Vulcanimicrobiota bacterium]